MRAGAVVSAGVAARKADTCDMHPPVSARKLARRLLRWCLRKEAGVVGIDASPRDAGDTTAAAWQGA